MMAAVKAGENESEKKINVDADEVFLLMKKEARVSRNMRACWFFRHLNTSIIFTPPQELQPQSLMEELTLVSFVPVNGGPFPVAGQQYSVGITTGTTVNFIASRYRIVFMLDLSPCCVAMDIAKGEILLHEIFQSLATCLKGLVTPFQLRGSHFLFAPKLFTSIIAHAPVICSTAKQVFIHGVSVTAGNVDRVLRHVHERLMKLEGVLAASFRSLDEELKARQLDHCYSIEDGWMEQASESIKMSDERHQLCEGAFVGLLRRGILGLQMLPENSSSGLVVVTDGVVGVPESAILDQVLAHLRSSTTSCSFLAVAPASFACFQSHLGHVPNRELMQLIATATFGRLFLSCPSVAEGASHEPNCYHRAIFYWSFQKGLSGFSCNGVQDEVIGSPSWFMKHLQWHPLTGVRFGSEVLHQSHSETTLQIGLDGVLSVRLREGYTIKRVRFVNDGADIEVILVLPWRDNGQVEYVATASWPWIPGKQPTKVGVHVGGSYDFLHEVTGGGRAAGRSPYRVGHKRAFSQLLSTISKTDQLLVHLQSFSTNMDHFDVPESIQKCVPLFVVDLDLNDLVINPQLCIRSSQQLTQFAAFWRPVVSLDTNIWQKWVHPHRISLLLEQELPLPRYIHTPNSIGCFSLLSCRPALASLSQTLSGWATFVLAENHAYVKYLYRHDSSQPSFFCLLRLTSEPPFGILHLGFLGGTPNQVRRDEIRSLKRDLAQLRFPRRYTQTTQARYADKKVDGRKLCVNAGVDATRKPPLSRDWSDIFCCTVLRKPLEKIIIRYDQKPDNMSVVGEGPTIWCHHPGRAWSAGRTRAIAGAQLTTLSHYLLHRRFVWSIQLSPSIPVPQHLVSKMLQTIAKVRLQEAFHFAWASSGMCNMVMEVDMMDHKFNSADQPISEVRLEYDEDDERQTCLVQYVLFPPHSNTSRDSVSSEEMDQSTEADGEVQIVTECWVEPQFGCCVNNPRERIHLDGLTCEDLPTAFYRIDYDCISSLTTFYHLHYLCHHDDLSPSLPAGIARSMTSSPPSTPAWRHVPAGKRDEDGKGVNSGVSFISFPFDLLALLPRSQQAELLFSTFTVGPGESCEAAGCDLSSSNELLFSLLSDRLRGIHDAEPFLSSDDAAAFFYVLRSRPRDSKKYPFPFRRGRPMDESRSRPDVSPVFMDAGQVSGTTRTHGGGRRGAATMHQDQLPPVSFQASGASSHPTPLPPTTVRSTHQCAATSQRVASHDVSNRGGGYTHNGPRHSKPMWKCYLKSVSAGHILLTFIPASYDDLLLLNELDTRHPVAVNMPTANEKKEDVSGCCGRVTGHVIGTPNVPCMAEDIDSSASVIHLVTPALNTGATPIALPVRSKSEDTESCHTGIMSGDDWEISGATSEGENLPLTAIPISGGSQHHSPECLLTPSSNDDVEDWIEASCPTVATSATGPSTVPIYVYDCHLSCVIESLVSRWTFTLPADLHEDMTFGADSSNSYSRSPPAAGGGLKCRLASFDGEERVTADEEEGRGNPRANYQSPAPNKSTDASLTGPAGVGEFQWHCQLVTESFFHCFVSALYRSLGHNYYVDRRDVDWAISHVCQESLPMEIDMTSFILSTCGHMTELVSHAVRRDMAARDGDCSGRFSVRFMEVVDIQSEASDAVQLPSVLRLPPVTVPVLCSMMSDGGCEASADRPGGVRVRFNDLVGRFFRPIPSAPTYFFYSPETHRLPSADEELCIPENLSPDNDHANGVSLEIVTGVKENGGSDQIAADVTPGHRVAHVSGELTFDEAISSSDVTAHSDVNKAMTPLFVHFTFTLKRKAEHHNITVTTLPVCLKSILLSMADPLLAIDFGNFHMTFDITCLTLPMDDVPEASEFSSAASMRSHSVEIADSHSVSEDEVERTDNSVASSEFVIEEPFSHLPLIQREAVSSLRSEILWLLYDEISLALRHMAPLLPDALEFVTRHVQSSSRLKRLNCSHQSIHLQFVYGVDKSRKHFVEEFERIRLQGFRLTKVGQYFVMTVERKSSWHVHHAQRLSLALSGLNSVDLCSANGSTSVISTAGPAVVNEVDVPGTELKHDSLALGVSSPNGSRLAGGQTVVDLSCCSGDQCQLGIDCRSCVCGGSRLRSPDMTVTSSSNRLHCEHRGVLRKSSSFSGFHGDQNQSLDPFFVSVDVNSSLQPTTMGAICCSRCSSARQYGFTCPNTPRSCMSTDPQSPSFESHAGGLSDGFDGDVSDDNADSCSSVSDSRLFLPKTPAFWLILLLDGACVEIFFQCSCCDIAENSRRGDDDGRTLILDTIQRVKDTCFRINQRLLLMELYETSLCSRLLVAEADEDVHWIDGPRHFGRTFLDPTLNNDDDDNDDHSAANRGYLAATMTFDPGHFACDRVWRRLFFLHPRLRSGAQRPSLSKGLLSLKLVLRKFSVANRSNMFVIKETTTDAIFYMNLKELSAVNLGDQWDVMNSLEFSGSDVSLFTLLRASEQRRRNADACSREADDQSVVSGRGPSCPLSIFENAVELAVHGMDEPGDEIKRDLMQVLQNRLDDAVLEDICIMLARNPQCKLRPDDVIFIQRPELDAYETVSLTIPGHALSYLSALLHYLHQNLLQFVHTANYLDASSDFRFQDVVHDKWLTAPQDQVYLYVSPNPGGGRRGMVCIVSSLVDGQGNPVTVLAGPQPSRHSACDRIFSDDYPKLVTATVYDSASCKAGPGPLALLQFRFWRRGAVDIHQLKDKVIAAVGHCLCDIIMEYDVLTAPICVESSAADHFNVAPMATVPNSPVSVKQNSEHERRCLSRKMSDSGRSSSRSASQSTSPLQALQRKFSFIPRVAVSARSTPSKAFDWSESADGGRCQRETSEDTQIVVGCERKGGISACYDADDMGPLHDVFVRFLEPWLFFCYRRGMPSVSRLQMALLSEHALGGLLTDVRSAMRRLGIDAQLRLFKVVPSTSPGAVPVVGVPVRLTSSFSPYSGFPRHSGSKPDWQLMEPGKTGHHYIAVAREHGLWGICVSDELQDRPIRIPKASDLNRFQSNQKFLPKCAEMLDMCGDDGSSSACQQTFIPRQKLLVVFVGDQKFVMYSYNYTNDVVLNLEKQVRSMVHWQNARCRLLHSLLFQKAGLFCLGAFTALPHNAACVDTHKDVPIDAENPFTVSTEHVDNLIRLAVPPRDLDCRHSCTGGAGSSQLHSITRMLNQCRPFGTTYKNMKPAHVMHRTRAPYAASADPVLRHGSQAQGVRTRFRCDAEKMMRLQDIYLAWQEKSSSRAPVQLEYIQLFKDSARLFHYCATPLLFLEHGQQTVFAGDEGGVKDDRATPTLIGSTHDYTASGQRQRSRRSSGASLACVIQRSPTGSDLNARHRHTSFSCSLLTVAGNNRTSTGSLGQDPSGGGPGDRTPHSDIKPSPLMSEMVVLGVASPRVACAVFSKRWHQRVCQYFLQQYCSYLVSEFGFLPVNVQLGCLKGQMTRDEHLMDSGLMVSLQKVLAGGIILIELTVQERHFFVKMYLLDYCSHHRIFRHEMQLLFVDECEKYKQLIHVHSFAHDVHLRCVTDYLRGDDSVLPADFDVPGFLSRFLDLCSVPPSFARNCIAHEMVELTDLPCPGPQLFTYILTRCSQHGMHVINVTCADSPVVKFAMVQTWKLDRPIVPEMDSSVLGAANGDYDVTIIIRELNDDVNGHHDASSSGHALRLSFFVILTSIRDVHPRLKLEEKFGDLLTFGSCETVATAGHSSSAGGLSAPAWADDGERFPVPVMQHVGLRQEHVNYLGYSNVHQTRLYGLLTAQCWVGCKRIETMVEMSKVECRKDYLWGRLHAGVMADSRQRGRTDSRVDVSRPLSLLPGEFEELLAFLQPTALAGLDSRLEQCSGMRASWYSGLAALLERQTGFRCHSFRGVPAGVTHTVFFSEHCSRMFILMTVDSQDGCTALNQVSRSSQDFSYKERHLGSDRFPSMLRQFNASLNTTENQHSMSKGVVMEPCEMLERRQFPDNTRSTQRVARLHTALHGKPDSQSDRRDSMVEAGMPEDLYNECALVETFVDTFCFHLWTSIH